MKLALLAVAAGSALTLLPAAASAHCHRPAHYVVSYQPHYVRRVVVVRERVWRPVYHRVYYTTGWRSYRVVPTDYYRSLAYDYNWEPPSYWGARRWRRERWEHHHWRNWEHGW
jgi:hypothetical protein